jgi:hypothetical protein
MKFRFILLFLESTESLPTAGDNHIDTQTKNEFHSFNENKSELIEPILP